MLRFSTRYFLLAILLLIVEILIALYLNDALIRPYGGNVLVVILMYCAVRSLFNVSPLKAALGVLAFAFLIEILQYFNIVQTLGLQQYKTEQVILGTSFSLGDLLCYTLGIIIVLLTENVFNREPIFKK